MDKNSPPRYASQHPATDLLVWYVGVSIVDCCQDQSFFHFNFVGCFFFPLLYKWHFSWKFSERESKSPTVSDLASVKWTGYMLLYKVRWCGWLSNASYLKRKHIIMKRVISTAVGMFFISVELLLSRLHSSQNIHEKMLAHLPVVVTCRISIWLAHSMVDELFSLTDALCSSLRGFVSLSKASLKGAKSPLSNFQRWSMA